MRASGAGQISVQAKDEANNKTPRKRCPEAVWRAKRARRNTAYAQAVHHAAIVRRFLAPARTHNGGDYGGDFANRPRLFRKAPKETHGKAVGDIAAHEKAAA
jgi:hypothetical protein